MINKISISFLWEERKKNFCSFYVFFFFWIQKVSFMFEMRKIWNFSSPLSLQRTWASFMFGCCQQIFILAKFDSSCKSRWRRKRKVVVISGEALDLRSNIKLLFWVFFVEINWNSCWQRVHCFKCQINNFHAREYKTNNFARIKLIILVINFTLNSRAIIMKILYSTFCHQTKRNGNQSLREWNYHLCKVGYETRFSFE